MGPLPRLMESGAYYPEVLRPLCGIASKVGEHSFFPLIPTLICPYIVYPFALHVLLGPSSCGGQQGLRLYFSLSFGEMSPDPSRLISRIGNLPRDHPQSTELWARLSGMVEKSLSSQSWGTQLLNLDNSDTYVAFCSTAMEFALLPHTRLHVHAKSMGVRKPATMRGDGSARRWRPT